MNSAPYILKLTGGPTRRTQWSWFLQNPQSGGFGQNAGAGVSRARAIWQGIRVLPVGTRYVLVVNGKEIGEFIRREVEYAPRATGMKRARA